MMTHLKYGHQILELTWGKAELYSVTGNQKEVIESLDKALEIEPTNTEVIGWKGGYTLCVLEKDLGLEILQEAKDLGSTDKLVNELLSNPTARQDCKKYYS